MIFFLTRALYPLHSAGGGIARYLQIRELVRAGEQVRIVLPWDGGDESIRGARAMYGPSVELLDAENPVSLDVGRALQALGVFDDYLSGWAHRIRTVVRKQMSNGDIILATSGGELGTLQLGALLKASTGCRLVFHLHDPPDHVDIDGLRVPSRFLHRNRKRAFARVLAAADHVYTTNEAYARHLAARYGIGSKVSGRYIFDRDLLSVDGQPTAPRTPNFVYGGNMSAVQRPELFYPGWVAAREKASCRLTFVGNTAELASRAGKLDGVTCIPTMARDTFLDYAKASIDIGLVSLFSPYHSYCTPSKLFDYLLIGKPVLVVGSGGDMVDVVTGHGLGLTSRPGDVRTLADNIVRLADPGERERMRTNVVRYAAAMARTPMYPHDL